MRQLAFIKHDDDARATIVVNVVVIEDDASQELIDQLADKAEVIEIKEGADGPGVGWHRNRAGQLVSTNNRSRRRRWKRMRQRANAKK